MASMKLQMTITFTKLLCLSAILMAAVVSILLESEGPFVVVTPVAIGAVANQDYQTRKKTQVQHEKA